MKKNIFRRVFILKMALFASFLMHFEPDVIFLFESVCDFIPAVCPFLLSPQSLKMPFTTIAKLTVNQI